MLTMSETRGESGVHVNDSGRELALVSWLGTRSARPTAEAVEQAYRAIAGELRERGCVPLQERVFADLHLAPVVARGRAAALGSPGGAWPVAPTLVEGSPVGQQGISGIHVLAARGEARPLREGENAYGTLVETAEARILGLADVGRRGAGRLAPGPAEEASAAIDAAEQLLAREGFSFREVARTWFYLRDILDWYGPFNAVRNAAFRRMGLVGPQGDGRIPASTGIEGRSARGGWCTLDLIALRPRAGGRASLRRLHNRRQNEATEYGSSFARATELSLGDARYVFVSGTAAIDDQGATVHAGDFEAQVRFTLDAVQALLEGVGAGLADVRQATAFLKNPCDGRSFERIKERSELAAAPVVTTVADVCRHDLLFEIDATAVVPSRGSRR